MDFDQASRCSALQHPVAEYQYPASYFQQMAKTHFASFRWSPLPARLGGPCTQTTANMPAEHLGPPRFSATAGASITDAGLHRKAQTGAQVNASDSNYCGNRQNASSPPHCSSHNNGGVEPVPSTAAPAFISPQQLTHTPRDSFANLPVLAQRMEVGSASDASVGLAAESPLEPNQHCQQILSPSGPGATSLAADRLSSGYRRAAAPLRSAGVCNNYRPRPCVQATALLYPGTFAPAVPQMAALLSYPSEPPQPESHAGAQLNFLQNLRQALLNHTAAPNGASAPAPAPRQLPAGQPLQVAKLQKVAGVQEFCSLSAGPVACGQGPNEHGHQRQPALAPGPWVPIAAPDVDSNASKSNDSVGRSNVSRLQEVELDVGGSFAVHTLTDGSSGTQSAAVLPPPVTVQVASRSRRNGDGGNAASGRGRLTRGAIGLFHPKLYLKGAECIECATEMMSRGRFERLAGSATAKWHVSIKVLPSGMTLGKWLQKHGLPILQGRARKRRADHQDEGVNEEGDENSGLLQGVCRSTFNPLASRWLSGAQDAAAAALAAVSGGAVGHMLSQAAATTTAACAEGGAHPVAVAWNHQTATEREVDKLQTRHCASEAEADPLVTLFECPEIFDVLEASDTPAPVQDARGPAPGKPRCLPPGRTLLPGNKPPGSTAAATGPMDSGNGPAVSPETAAGSQAMGMAWSGVAPGSGSVGVGSPAVAAIPAVDGWQDAAATPQMDRTGHSCWGVGWREQGATAAAPFITASAEAGPGVPNQASQLHFLSLDAGQTDSQRSTSGGASMARPAPDGVLGRPSGAHDVAAVGSAYHHLALQNGSGTDWTCSSSDVSRGNSRQNSYLGRLEPWGSAGPTHHSSSHGALGGGGDPSSGAPIPMPHIHCLMAPGPVAPQTSGSLLHTAGVAVSGGSGWGPTSAGGSTLSAQLKPQMVPHGCSQYQGFVSEEQQQQQSMVASWGHFPMHPQLQAQAAQAPGGWLALQSV